MRTFNLLTVMLLLLVSCTNDDDGSIAPCEIPANFSVSAINDFSATLNWDDTGAGSYKIEYGVAGFTQGEGLVATTNVPEVTLVDLVADETYEYHVQSICSATNVSEYSNLQTFTTDVAPDIHN
ncbi:MAG: fibronectin type III domain-containing protein [Gelidibacter sp.]